MPPAVEVKGRAASGGIFAGPLLHFAKPQIARRKSGTPAGELEALAAAIARATEDIQALIERVESAAAEILGFQIAMLEDEALSDPAKVHIAEGLAADQAWVLALNGEIAGYEQSGEEYFRARAADLKDIRDRVLRHLSGGPVRIESRGQVLAGEDMAPTAFLETDWSRGGAIVLASGSATSHVAMLARARGIPMVVGLGEAVTGSEGEAIVDGGEGVVVFRPSLETKNIYLTRQTALAKQKEHEASILLEPARLRDGTRVEVLVNVAGVDELDTINPRSCDGIGLMRSEFLFRDGEPLPDEESQYQAYRRFVEWAEGRPVTVRTLDIGGDKPIAGLTADSEKNPFLGLRGVRLTLARPDVFKTQLRALARAASHSNLKIMIPMVSIPGEIARTAQLLDECVDELQAAGVACARPPLGIMVEVPAVAVAPELFTTAKFFSIGSNDLTQYVMAASRDEQKVAELNDPSHPAVVRLIAQVAAFGRENNIPVSLCGDMASEPKHLARLLEAGVTTFSVAPAAIARVKIALAGM